MAGLTYRRPNEGLTTRGSGLRDWSFAKERIRCFKLEVARFETVLSTAKTQYSTQQEEPQWGCVEQCRLKLGLTIVIDDLRAAAW